MGIFRRGSKDDRTKDHGTQDQGTDHTSAERDPRTTGRDGENGSDGLDADGVASVGPRRQVRGGGPFDRSEVEGLEGRLDLGSLWLTGVPGMELRLEVEEESQNVVGVTAVLGESAVQLQAFAAPRSEGIWDDIRTEIAASVTSQGGTADKTSGPLGAELRAQMPAPGPDGRTVFSPVRFVGVDGPRWFLRAVLSGPAAVDENAATILLDVVRATVVVRGDEAMAPRELLSLRLPDQPDGEVLGADAVANTSADNQVAGGSGDEHRGGANGSVGGPSFDDFKPFERGPEITEIH